MLAAGMSRIARTMGWGSQVRLLKSQPPTRTKLALAVHGVQGSRFRVRVRVVGAVIVDARHSFTVNLEPH